MSRRSDALRRIAAAFPEPPQLSGAMHDLRNEGDRSAAIMAAAMVEYSVERLLRAGFKNQNAERNKVLFGSNGALSSFAGKIQIAAAFGLINEVGAHELTRIKNIRNVFAHAATNIDFTHPDIAAEVDGFTLLKVIRDVPGQSLATFKDSLTGKFGFLVITHLLVVVLDSDIRKQGGEPIYDRAPDAKLASALFSIEDDETVEQT